MTAVGLANRITVLVAVQATGVILVIMIMSGMGCTLLSDASKTWGPVGYVVLNFALHYVPLIAILASAPPEHTQVKLQLRIALAIVVMYVLLHPGINEYGCPVTKLVPLAALFGLTLAVSLAFVAWRL